MNQSGARAFCQSSLDQKPVRVFSKLYANSKPPGSKLEFALKPSGIEVDPQL